MYAQILKRGFNPKSLQEGMELHSLTNKSGFEAEIYIVCAKYRKISDVGQVFDIFFGNLFSSNKHENWYVYINQ